MDTSELKSPVIILAVLVLAFFLLVFTQGNPTQFFLFPILLITFIISWYLHREIQNEHKEHTRHDVHHFKTKLHSLAKQHMLSVIIVSSIILLSFIFFWSFFVSGLITALLNTGLSLLLYILFIAYSLTAPKELTQIFKHVPKQYRHHSNNQWVHNYLLLLPFAVLCYVIYSFTNAGDIVSILLGLPGFLFFYTLLVICLYCSNYLYQEYKSDKENIVKKTAKRFLEE